MHNYLNICLIVFFSLLIMYNVYLKLGTVKEGMENDTDNDNDYKEYPNDPIIMAQQNAGNIKVLKQLVDTAMNTLNKIKPTLDGLNNKVDSNTSSIQSIIQGQQDSVNEKIGINSKNPPGDISGLD
mgnify:CR=1 FL=1